MVTTTLIPHSRPYLGQREIAAVSEVIESQEVGQGFRVARFEQSMADYLGLLGGVAVSSGTAALHMALLALGVSEGNEVVMPSYVCAAPWIATTHIGAVPKIVDIDPSTFGIDVEQVKAAITGKTRAIIVPHLFGCSADLAPLQALKIPIIEDCAQTLGAMYHGQPVGSYGHATICSFYATKLLCTGEGGMVLSNNARTVETLHMLREYDEKQFLYPKSFNYKMTDLQAALGLCQLERFPDSLMRRATIAHRYLSELAHLPVGLPFIPQDRTHIFYRFVLKISHPIDESIQRLEGKGIQCRRPVYQPLHRYLGLRGFPHSDHVFSTALSIPIHPSLTDEDVDRIITILQEEFT